MELPPPPPPDSPIKLHGLTFPSNLLSKNIKDTMMFSPTDGDIILASYPNAGGEWLRHVVLKLVGDYSATDVTFKMVPLLESSGPQMLEALYDPRIYRHHMPYHMVKKNPLAKCLYIYRNPEDTFAAYYYHLCRRKRRKQNLEKAFEKFLTGVNMEYGRYFEHARSFFSYRNNTNVLLVSFDKLYHSHKEEVLRIAEFLDKEYHEELLKSEPTLTRVLNRTSYENIPYIGNQPHESAFTDKPKEGDDVEVVGGGQKLISAVNLQKLHDLSAQVLRALNLLTEHGATTSAGTSTGTTTVPLVPLPTTLLSPLPATPPPRTPPSSPPPPTTTTITTPTSPTPPVTTILTPTTTVPLAKTTKSPPFTTSKTKSPPSAAATTSTTRASRSVATTSTTKASRSTTATTSTLRASRATTGPSAKTSTAGHDDPESAKRVKPNS